MLSQMRNGPVHGTVRTVVCQCCLTVDELGVPVISVQRKIRVYAEHLLRLASLGLRRTNEKNLSTIEVITRTSSYIFVKETKYLSSSPRSTALVL